jgi:hypothetical protein
MGDRKCGIADWLRDRHQSKTKRHILSIHVNADGSVDQHTRYDDVMTFVDACRGEVDQELMIRLDQLAARHDWRSE